MERGRREGGSLDNRLNDVESAKAIGINIFGVIDVGRGRSAEAFLAGQAEYYDAGRRQSDRTFLVMPNMENTGIEIGGHHDLMLSRPTFWQIGRMDGQPLVEPHPKYGKVYHLGGPADLFEMTRRENMIINMPHPRAKGSTGFPDGVKETHFAQETYEGAGYRWGMGIDGSEKRLCEYRCLGLFDEMTNWYVDRPIPLKHMQIPFNAAGKKWGRFAAWDVATNGAFVQPIRLTTATTSTTGR